MSRPRRVDARKRDAGGGSRGANSGDFGRSYVDAFRCDAGAGANKMPSLRDLDKATESWGVQVTRGGRRTRRATPRRRPTAPRTCHCCAGRTTAHHAALSLERASRRGRAGTGRRRRRGQRCAHGPRRRSRGSEARRSQRVMRTCSWGRACRLLVRLNELTRPKLGAAARVARDLHRIDVTASCGTVLLEAVNASGNTARALRRAGTSGPFQR